MPLLPRLCFLAGLALSGTAAAQDTTIASATFNGWQIHSFRSPSTGQFSHCAASARYRSGTTLLFSINHRIGWNIGFVNEKWNLATPSSIPLQYRIDQLGWRRGTATTISNRHVTMNLPDDSQFFQQMRSGQLLYVDAGGQSFQFQLTGTSVILQTLLRCASSAGVDISPQGQTAQPREAPPATRPTATGGNAEQRLEATQFAANLLAQEQMRGFRLLSSSELRASSLPEFFRASDVVWQREGVTGSIRVLAGRAGQGAEELAAALIADDARNCRGEFASGRTADTDLPAIRRVQTYCSNQGGRPVVLAYLFLPMRGGVIYQMSTFANGDRQATTAEDQRLRDAVRAVAQREPQAPARPPTAPSSPASKL
jgi:hypothetical protein